MTELVTPDLEPRYAALPTFSWSTFNKGSLLGWVPGRSSKREKFFKSVKSFEEALVRIQKRYPRVQLIRAGSLANPMGDFGDFFVGNMHAALNNYTNLDTNHSKRSFPIIVYASLIEVLSQMRQGKIEVDGSWAENAARFTQNGTINFTFPSQDGQSIFKLEKPPLDKSSHKELWKYI